jgi:hypothetical protein
LAQQFDPAAYQAQQAAIRAELLREFPFERIEVPGADALSEWLRLRSQRRAWPVVVGGDEDFFRVAEAVVGYQGDPNPVRTPEQILTAAQALHHPESIRQLRRAELERFREWMRTNPNASLPTVIQNGAVQSEEETRLELEQLADEGQVADIGVWPATPPPSPGLSVAIDVLSGKAHERVHIVLLPTQVGFEAAAFLRWGGWNECPAPEYHVAALRNWGERYGAELVGVSGDVINLRVARRPENRLEALSLAREQFDYCSDIVSQGTGDLSTLAAALMADNWWFFWWD